MDKVQRLHRFWSWLPAFRAVAETQHLPSAAEKLHVSPSALSRTIRLLEDDLGEPLFDRTGRAIRLNASGELLLSVTRIAMRSVHEGVLMVEGGQFMGAVRIASAAPFVPLYVLPAISKVRKEHPLVVPHLCSMPLSQITPALLQGSLDLAIIDEEVFEEQLSVVHLREMKHDICAAPSHPFAKLSKFPLDRIEELQFVAPEGNMDAWPVGLERNVVIRVTQMQVAIDACQSEEFVAVLPVDVALANGLVPLKFDGVRSTQLYLLSRPSLSIHGKIDAVAQTIRALS